MDDVDVDITDKALYFNVSRYENFEEERLPLDNTFNPIVVYKKPNSEKYVMRFHTESAAKYNPNINVCNVESSVEFVDKNGELSKDVFTDNEDQVEGDFAIQQMKTSFYFSKQDVQINLNFKPSCFLKVRIYHY